MTGLAGREFLVGNRLGFVRKQRLRIAGEKVEGALLEGCVRWQIGLRLGDVGRKMRMRGGVIDCAKEGERSSLRGLLRGGKWI